MRPYRKERPGVPTTDQSSLNLVMRIRAKTPDDPVDHYQALQAILSPRPDGGRSELAVALDRLRTVHFARFFFIGREHLCLVTSYDGRFEDYVNDFIEQISLTFNTLLLHLDGAPSLPVEKNRPQFIKYVRERDVPTAGGGMYSAYPGLSVVRILTLAGVEARLGS
jgi:hypothetical protein